MRQWQRFILRNKWYYCVIRPEVNIIPQYPKVAQLSTGNCLVTAIVLENCSKIEHVNL